MAHSLLTADRPAASFVPANFGHSVNIQSYEGPQGSDEQVTGQTTHIMARLVREDAPDPIITEPCADIARRASTTQARADAVWWYLKNRITFIGDEQQIEPFDFFFPPDELLIRPTALLTMQSPMDDCDGFSMATAAMLRTLGIRSYFKTIAARRSTPDNYSHVYVVAELADGSLYPLDVSNGPLPGVEAYPQFKAKLWPIDDEPDHRRQGPMIHNAPSRTLGAIDYGQIISSFTDIAGKVLIPRYGTPPAGTFINTGPAGQTISTYPGGGATAAAVLPGGMDSTTLLLLGGGALLLVVLMSGRR